MSFKVFGSSVAGTVVGGAIGVTVGGLAAALLGIDDISSIVETLSESPEANHFLDITQDPEFRKYFGSALEKIEKVDPSFLNQEINSLLPSEIVEQIPNEIPPLSEELKAELSDKEEAAYEVIKQNWDIITETATGLAPTIDNVAISAVATGAVGAATGGYAGYKIAGGGEEKETSTKWRDHVTENSNHAIGHSI